MRNRFPGKSCVLCTAGSGGVGEHVWSHWLLGEFADEGPFHTTRSEVAYTNRDGDIASFTGMPGVHVPMCGKHNEILKVLVEDPAFPVVRGFPTVAGEPWPTLTTDEGAALGRWFLKVGLLLAHPDAEHDNPHVVRDASLDLSPSDFRPEWVQWMADGVDPADDFSVYATRRDLSGTWAGDTETLLLPGVVQLPGRDLHFFERSLGVRDLQATIVWHPGWPLQHPLVESGRAAVLWPPSSGPLDLDALPPVDPREFRFVVDGSALRLSEEEYKKAATTPLRVGELPATLVLAQH